MNNIKIKSGLTASDLKYIAVMAMFIDHVAYLFVPDGTVLYCCMRFIGRTTAPIMCFFISEGYHYTRNLKKYFQRMAVFAVISHFAFAFCFNTHEESMITTLFLCLLAVHVVNKGRKEFILPTVLIICCLADFCDWGMEAVIYTLVFEVTRQNRKNQLLTYGITAGVFRFMQIFVYKNWYSLGIFVPIPLLLLYNGKKGGGKYTKWVFYVFYPAHLLLLGVINYELYADKI
ncbi:MAG: conjugal transfer protein TraX [Ruminococcus flavefaciens]|nr:conjugal transfer protein TraX [Ruminococcus flavefaciens]